MVSASEWNRRARAAQRKAEQDFKRQVAAANRQADAHNRREVARVNREIAAANRAAEAQAKSQVEQFNRKVDTYNRRATAHNRKVIDDLNRQLAARGRTVIRYTDSEQQLVDRVQDAPVSAADHDVFLSYARIDGTDVATELRHQLVEHGLTVWFDEFSIVPGRSQALQMDKGLARAKTGVVVLTPAYLTGRFWTERELGVLLGKETLIPVLDKVTFTDVKEYSGMLPDLAGFETARDDVETIAAKIAGAVLPLCRPDAAA